MLTRWTEEIRRRYNGGYLWMDRPTPVTGAPALQTTFRPRAVTTTTTGAVRTRRDTSHTFHLIMTILTGGAWVFVWAGMAILHSIGRRKRSTVKTRTTVESR